MKKVRRLLITMLISGMLLGNCMTASAAEYFLRMSGGSLINLQEGDILYPGDVIVLPTDSNRFELYINGNAIMADYPNNGIVNQNSSSLPFVGWYADEVCTVSGMDAEYSEVDGVMRGKYYITLSSSAPQTSQVPSCAHSYQQTTIVPLTFETDEVIGEKCTKCGAVRQDVAPIVRPNSAYGYFLGDMSEQILDAPQGGEVFIETETWVSFSRAVMEALAARPDVSLTVEYLYEGKYYTLTIPAGYDVMSLLDENGYAGFRWVDMFVGGHEIEK